MYCYSSKKSFFRKTTMFVCFLTIINQAWLFLFCFILAFQFHLSMKNNYGAIVFFKYIQGVPEKGNSRFRVHYSIIKIFFG